MGWFSDFPVADPPEHGLKVLVDRKVGRLVLGFLRLDGQGSLQHGHVVDAELFEPLDGRLIVCIAKGLVFGAVCTMLGLYPVHRISSNEEKRVRISGDNKAQLLFQKFQMQDSFRMIPGIDIPPAWVHHCRKNLCCMLTILGIYPMFKRSKVVLSTIFALFFFAWLGSFPCGSVLGQDEGWVEQPEILKRIEKSFLDPPECKKVVEDGRIWIHRDEQAVIVDGYVCQRNAPLEMFACPIGTKEHESIVAVFAKSRFVHASLLAVGGSPGKPVAFEPKFTPASGTTVRVYALWHDEKGETQAILAQNWIRQTGTKKPMLWDWVFAGSKIYKDPDTGNESYLGDGGELVSVANFMTSTLDVAVKSDAANSGLVFEAYTDKIPKRFTPIRLVMVLSDQAPYSSDQAKPDPIKEKSKTDEKDQVELPKHLTEPVPKRLLEFLPPKKS